MWEGEQKGEFPQIMTQKSGNVEQRPGSEAEMCGGEGGCLLGFSKGQGGPSRAEIRSRSRRPQGKRRGAAGPAGGGWVEKGLRSAWACDPGGITDQLCKHDKPFILGASIS